MAEDTAGQAWDFVEDDRLRPAIMIPSGLAYAWKPSFTYAAGRYVILCNDSFARCPSKGRGKRRKIFDFSEVRKQEISGLGSSDQTITRPYGRQDFVDRDSDVSACPAIACSCSPFQAEEAGDAECQKQTIWVAVQELELSYNNSETILFTTSPYYGHSNFTTSPYYGHLNFTTSPYYGHLN